MRKKKYFVVSDVHSYLRPLRKALRDAGWNPKTKSHVLVVLGDIFDRGDDTVGVYEFIRSIPKDRRVLVRGNHEALLLDLLKKDCPDRYDYSNGTVKTLCHIAGCDEKYLDSATLAWDFLDGRVPNAADYDNCQDYVVQMFNSRFSEVKGKAERSDVIGWLRSDEWVDYFELKNYVMVHSFIPVREAPHKMSEITESGYFPTWRTDATEKEWHSARWGCPYRQYDAGLFDPEIANGKTLVCGHWHTFDFRNHYEHRMYDEYDIRYDPSVNAIYRHGNIIALDACTVLSNTVNVLRIEE